MSSKKKAQENDTFEEELVETLKQDKPPGAFEVVVEDYEADGPSTMQGPTIEAEDKAKATDNEFGVDLSHLTPSARERTLEEMRAGAAKAGRGEHDPKKTKA
jgi:hypothetical protein